MWSFFSLVFSSSFFLAFLWGENRIIYFRKKRVCKGDFRRQQKWNTSLNPQPDQAVTKNKLFSDSFWRVHQPIMSILSVVTGDGKVHQKCMLTLNLIFGVFLCKASFCILELRKDGNPCHAYQRKIKIFLMHFLPYCLSHWCTHLPGKTLQCPWGQLCTFLGVPCSASSLFALKKDTELKLLRSSKRRKGRAFVSVLTISHHLCLFRWSIFQSLLWVCKFLCVLNESIQADQGEGFGFTCTTHRINVL